MNPFFIILVLLTTLTTIQKVYAVNPDEILNDPVLERRARDISKGLRCLVCQNENIDDSNAELARDLRLLVREQLKTGASNQEIIDYIVSRYGDFVLLQPPFKAQTWALWLGPPLFSILGIVAFIRLFYRQRRRTRNDIAMHSNTEEK